VVQGDRPSKRVYTLAADREAALLRWDPARGVESVSTCTWSLPRGLAGKQLAAG
jgi:hypothetical protein